MLPIDLKIDRAQRLLRMIEDDAPLLAARFAPLSAERQKSAKSYAERLAERTRAEIWELLEERNLLAIAEQTPAAAD
jgi:hypothetical protein